MDLGSPIDLACMNYLLLSGDTPFKAIRINEPRNLRPHGYLVSFGDDMLGSMVN